MKRKRLLLILGCLAGVLLAGYSTLWLTASRQHITEENIQAIKMGMTEAEVEARMRRLEARMRRWTGNES